MKEVANSSSTVDIYPFASEEEYVGPGDSRIEVIRKDAEQFPVRERGTIGVRIEFPYTHMASEEVRQLIRALEQALEIVEGGKS